MSIWGSECSEEEEKESDIEREWKARHHQFHTLGYRDGIDAGKNMSVQEGFENGFKESVGIGFRLGLTRGWTSAFEALPEETQKWFFSEDNMREKFNVVSKTLSAISANKAAGLFLDHVKGEGGNIVEIEDSIQSLGLQERPPSLVEPSERGCNYRELEALQGKTHEILKSSGISLSSPTISYSNTS